MSESTNESKQARKAKAKPIKPGSVLYCVLEMVATEVAKSLEMNSSSKTKPPAKN